MFLISNSSFEVKETKNKGRGVFAKAKIKKVTIIGDYLGRATPYEEVLEEDIDYMMFFDDKLAIIPDRSKPGLYLINHSCSPNCFMMPRNGHMLFVAIKDINPQEELNINYLYPPKDSCNPCDHVCLCGHSNCTGTMHTSKKLHEKWGKFKDELKKKQRVEKVIKNGVLMPLASYPQTIRTLMPGLDLDEKP